MGHVLAKIRKNEHVLAKMYENESHASYKCKISQFPANIPIFCSILPANSLVKILRYFASRIASKIGLCLTPASMGHMMLAMLDPLSTCHDHSLHKCTCSHMTNM